MRITISLLSLAVAVAACNDQDRLTSPITNANAVPVPTADVSTVTGKAPAKPTDQVGFTKMQYFESGYVTVAVGQTGSYTLNCPAGTFVVSGGHNIWGGGVAPLIRLARVEGNGWRVWLDNEAADAQPLSFKVSVNCIS